MQISFLTHFQKAVLGLAGITAVLIGAFILAAPHAFYASYGIALGEDVNLLSELRAPAGGLFTLGAIMLLGLFRPRWTDRAVFSAFTVFIAFPAGRIVSVLADGLPNGSIVSAFTVELLIAGLLFLAFARNRAVTTRSDRIAEAG